MKKFKTAIEKAKKNGIPYKYQVNILLCSGGNDSVALIQWAKNEKLENVYVIYNDTGWAVDWWYKRIRKIKRLCRRYGFKFVTLTCEGFEVMVRRKKGFPMPASKMQFCSDVLKTQPFLKWLNENNIKNDCVIYTGKRRAESKHREFHPYEILSDMKYEGRKSVHPLVYHSEKERDFLADETGIDILLHSSLECFPCVNSNRADFRLLARYPERIEKIAKIENEMGYTSKGKPRVMFRPYRHMGAIGIKEVVKWGLCDRGKYKKT